MTRNPATPDYQVSWITADLAVGHAPMSYQELSEIKDQGINAIVNLCAEFSDLHEIETDAGFEVYYLPIWDEDIPEMDAMEKALEWLDEALYLGKKVLVHCRHGIGRTGTFVTSYMIRRGMGMKRAKKKLKNFRASPTNYGQWKLLRRYNKQSGILKIREPSLELHHQVDLSHFIADYESLIQKTAPPAPTSGQAPNRTPCGKGDHPCCRHPFALHFMEVVYLHSGMNRHLSASRREALIIRAAGAVASREDKCPLNDGNGCALFEMRPIRCRIYAENTSQPDLMEIHQMVEELSRTVFLALSGHFSPRDPLTFSMAETISGKFVQKYFHRMMAMEQKQAQL